MAFMLQTQSLGNTQKAKKLPLLPACLAGKAQFYHKACIYLNNPKSAVKLPATKIQHFYTLNPDKRVWAYGLHLKTLRRKMVVYGVARLAQGAVTARHFKRNKEWFELQKRDVAQMV